MQREYVVEVKEQLSRIEHIKAESMAEAVDIVKKMQIQVALCNIISIS